MKRADDESGRDIVEALRRFDRAPSPSPDEVHALTRRIVASAGALLEARRDHVEWWEYPAVWARTLIPLGITTALVAAACLLWASVARLPLAAPPAATANIARGAETDDMVPQRMLYSLVAPVEQNIVPAGRAR